MCGIFDSLRTADEDATLLVVQWLHMDKAPFCFFHSKLSHDIHICII